MTEEQGLGLEAFSLGRRMTLGQAIQVLADGQATKQEVDVALFEDRVVELLSLDPLKVNGH